MSQLSLKEQLEALSLTPSSSSTSLSPKKQKTLHTTEGKNTQKSEKKPAWLEYAQYGVELLKAYFPACFKDVKEIKPVKIGIKQELVKRLSTYDNIVIGDKACMIASLAYYVNSAGYHKSVVAGETRIDLDGAPVGLVTTEEAHYSRECRQAKLQKKNKSSHQKTSALPK